MPIGKSNHYFAILNFIILVDTHKIFKKKLEGSSLTVTMVHIFYIILNIKLSYDKNLR